VGHENKFIYVEVQPHAFLTPELDGGECSASSLGRFIPGETTTGIHWIGGWIGRRSGPDTVARIKSNFPVPARNLTLVIQTVPSHVRVYSKLSGLAAWSENSK